MLLSLTLGNYRSFAAESTLDLMKRSFRRNVPADHNWAAVTEHVVGIYGANASGKSTVLLPLGLIQVAVAFSLRDPATTQALYTPHALHRDLPTAFQVEYVEAGVRYRWELRLSQAGVLEEKLEATESGHFRLIFHRQESTIKFGPQSGIPRAARENIEEFLTPWALTLSAWQVARSRGPYAGAVTWWQERLRTLGVLRDRAQMHYTLMDMLQYPSWMRASSAIIRAADTGVNSVRVDTQSVPLPPELAQHAEALSAALAGESSTHVEALSEQEKQLIAQNLVFTHGSGEEQFELPEEAESQGTRVWFDLAMQATYALATGGVLSVDEADESLHPLLLASLIRLFTNRRTNASGAQLLFTSHDTTVLGNDLDTGITPSGIWLTEKQQGVSELIALDEFPYSPKHNIERRYLRGVYGAVPAPQRDIASEIARLRTEYNQFQAERRQGDGA
ncbi:AAA family ATPase [Corynebacterium oculi]|uniref:ATPase AAA-type core domain-containing protein n=1 Tax=Corynebacterium oculi TaxID=1544416 RepID=A0A0N8VZN9_9CORY|nr:ATP-binding protein [Corynebacterium oculi]KQB84426.1 hypothetical protein Cocul_01227 [Corynebacterium oculi]